jgi:hypothetical protein
MVVYKNGYLVSEITPSDVRVATWSKTQNNMYTAKGDIIVSKGETFTYNQGGDTLTDSGGVTWKRTGEPSTIDYVLTPTTAPAVEIISKTGTCQTTDSLYIEGVIKSNTAVSLVVTMRGDAYDASDTKLGTGFDYVSLDPYGQSRFKIIVFDGCPSEGKGKYTVNIGDIRY